jgi:hypothetical protein
MEGALTLVSFDLHHRKQACATNIVCREVERCDLHAREPSVDLSHLRDVVRAESEL